jgi:hypothetical protein
MVDQTLAGIGVALALVIIGVVRYPASLETGMSSFLTSSAALLAYAALAVLARRSLSSSLKLALAQGAVVGCLLGIIALVNLLLEHFAPLGPRFGAALGVGMWGAMFLAFGGVGSATYGKVGSVALAAVSSVWSAIVSTVITVICGFLLNLLLMPRMQQILAPAFAQSGMNDPEAFVIRNTLNAASSHLLIAPLVALFFGFAGGLACSIIGTVRRSLVIAAAASALPLIIAGLFSIRFASMIPRAERPPFIMFGLLALGVALSCAHPVVTAIRRPAPSP